MRGAGAVPTSVTLVQLGPPEPALRAGIHHLEPQGPHVLHHLLKGLQQGCVQPGLKDGRGGLGDLRRDGVALLHPVLEAAIQHGDLLVPESPEHPPGAGSVEGAQVVPVIHHDVGVVADPQAPHVVGEVGLAGQHEVVRGGLVPALLDVEEGRPRDVPLLEFLPGVSLLRRVPRSIQDPQARPHPPGPQSLGEPFGADQRPAEHLRRHLGGRRPRRGAARGTTHTHTHTKWRRRRREEGDANREVPPEEAVQGRAAPPGTGPLGGLRLPRRRPWLAGTEGGCCSAEAQHGGTGLPRSFTPLLRGGGPAAGTGGVLVVVVVVAAVGVQLVLRGGQDARSGLF